MDTTRKAQHARSGDPTPILLKAVEAARFLAISERKLWSLRASGEIPSVEIGRAVRYCVEDLDRFVTARKTEGRR